MEKDLVICHTILQVEIAMKLYKSGRIDNFDFLLCVSSESNQIKSYYDAMSQLAIKSLLMTDRHWLLTSLKCLKLFFGKNYNSIYVANIEMTHVHYLMSVCKFKNIKTFDDGTANIFTSSMLYQGNNSRDGFLCYMGKKYALSDLRVMTEKHYTIYKDENNITENLEYVSLFDDAEFCENETFDYKEKTVLLGGVFRELSSKPWELVNVVKSILPEDTIYIPHPRDRSCFFDEYQKIDGFEIAERKILNLLKSVETINLYGFNSSTQLNLKSVARINNKCFSGRLIDLFDGKTKFEQIDI